MLCGILLTIDIQHLADMGMGPFAIRHEPAIALVFINSFRRSRLVHWEGMSLEVVVDHTDQRIVLVILKPRDGNIDVNRKNLAIERTEGI